jgi:hypothetical protein
MFGDEDGLLQKRSFCMKQDSTFGQSVISLLSLPLPTKDPLVTAYVSDFEQCFSKFQKLLKSGQFDGVQLCHARELIDLHFERLTEHLFTLYGDKMDVVEAIICARPPLTLEKAVQEDTHLTEDVRLGEGVSVSVADRSAAAENQNPQKSVTAQSGVQHGA